MADIKESIRKKLVQAQEVQSRNDLNGLEEILCDILFDYEETRTESDIDDIKYVLGAFLIDLGSDLCYTDNDNNAQKYTLIGIEVLVELEKNFPNEDNLYGLYYNIANGYATLLHLERNENLGKGIIPDYYCLQKIYLRKSLNECKKIGISKIDKSSLCQLYTNYGICLDAIGRNIEALDYYDAALKLDPEMGAALGNKGVTLFNLAFLVKGYTHICLLEAQQLLSKALLGNLTGSAQDTYKSKLLEIQRIIDFHEGSFEPEEIINEPIKSEFHKFFRQFSSRHNLYLSPTLHISQKEWQLFRDSLFPSTLTGSFEERKIERNINFINQIKQDYIFARYLLVRSQYHSKDIDAIDEDVDLYYAFDYSISGTYSQMMKVSFRLSVDILDKIASFVREYYELSKPSVSRTYFTNIWNDQENKNQLREELLAHRNLNHMALFDLSLDYCDQTQLGFYFTKQRRHALTHRFLTLLEMDIGQVGLSGENMLIDDFKDECIQVLKHARSAIFYLVSMIDKDERSKAKGEHRAEMPSYKIDGYLRWTPYTGERD